MIINNFSKYIEGQDLTKIAGNNLAYPSKNCLINKGKVVSRLGLSVFGAEKTSEDKITSQSVWKDAKSGIELPMRAYLQKVQVYLEELKDGAGWVDLISTIDADAVRIEFATWTDSNTAIIKKRSFFVDGSENMYQWNGGVATVKTVAGAVLTINGTKTLQQLGFDAGDGTQQTIIINGIEYTYSTTVASTSVTLDSSPSGVSEGDIVIVKPLTHTATLATFNKDHIFNYKNHLVISNLNTNELYFSDVAVYSMATGLSFTLPAPASRTATSPMYFVLDGDITAMIERKGVLWVSTVDDWFKVTKQYEITGYDEWATVTKIESADRVGALPFAVSTHKGNMIFIAQDKTIKTVSDLELIQSDQIELISDDIESLLLRYDLTDSRLYYNGRYIWISIPSEGITEMLDIVEGNWQPPQTIPMTCLSIIGGEKVGHSAYGNESFKVFDGYDDLGADIETIIALGYQNYDRNMNELTYKRFGVLGISGRITKNTKVKTDVYYETDGAKNQNSFVIDGSEILIYEVSDDASFGSQPFASRSWAGGDIINPELKRFLIFDKQTPTSFFDWRPIFTVVGKDQEFHLLAISADISKSTENIIQNLFTKK